MTLIGHEEFMTRLTALFEHTKNSGTIWLTTKRLAYDDKNVEMKLSEGAEDIRWYPILLRATTGTKNTRFSTRVEPGQLAVFHAVYGALLKSSMGTLRKRDKKRERQRAEEAAQRKKKRTESVVLRGPKRGSCRRTRQRIMKAIQKREEMQQQQEREGKDKDRARQN